MTTSLENKTSLKVPYQLPEFIRSDSQYQTFVSFIQAYYEWMEQNNIGNSKLGALYGTQNLLNFNDIDYSESADSFNRFIDYYTNDFLPNFPKDSFADKTKLIKIARELYSTKGTPASYKFLFRALYNSDTEVFPTRDVVLRASDGKWYVSKSLKLDSIDETFLAVRNYRIFGTTSKSIATVERGVFNGDKIELFISNIERLFQSGEEIQVVDNQNRLLYFKDGAVVEPTTIGAAPLKASILGSISSVEINTKKRGQLYNGRTSTYSGDPVVFYGGLNNENGIPAKAFVKETTTGSIRSVNVLSGGYGYRTDPNTEIRFASTTGGVGAIANVTALQPYDIINVAFVAEDALTPFILPQSLGDRYTFFLANTAADINCSLANAFSFTSFSTAPIADVVVNNGGGNYKTLPTVTAHSVYDTTDGKKADLESLGMLGPIRIIDGGTGYSNGDVIVFTGGTGYGANGNVTVNSGGTIVSVQYTPTLNENGINLYPVGGLGYRIPNGLPTLSVQGSGSNAVLNVNTILGVGASLQATPDERGIGAITSFVVENYGEDYISAPNISLRVKDLVVTNVSASNLVKAGEIVYQGTSRNSAVFSAYVDSISLLEQGNTDETSRYLLRTYNYTSNIKPNMMLNVTDRTSAANLYLSVDNTYSTIDSSGNFIFDAGVRTYGNGAAQATAKFLSGLIIGEGQYINDDGFPSSYQILENGDYNNFTYQLVVEQSFDAYRDIIFKLLHPSGTGLLTVNALKSEIEYVRHYETSQANSHTLGFYTGDAGSSASMYGSFSAVSNNIIKFNNLVGSNLEQFLSVGAAITINSNTGPNVYSTVVSVDSVSNTAIIKDNVFLSFANVAYGITSASNTGINITATTGQYDLINNGEYSDISNPIRDIIFNGDDIKIYANSTNIYTGKVSYISYSNNVVFVTPAPSFTSTNALISISRGITSTDVRIYNTLGSQFYPELTTESGDTLSTENGLRLLLG